MKQEAVNKALVRDFYRRALGAGDVAYAEQIIADDYRQHSPAMKPGKSGVLEAIKALGQMPKPATAAAPFMRLIAEGEYVVTNLRFDWGGQGKVVVDLFRVRQGRLVEHWDAVQDESEASLNGRALMDGPSEAGQSENPEAAKKTAGDFFRQVFMDRNPTALSDFITPDFIQHRPDLADGLPGLESYPQQPPGAFFPDKVLRIIGEGNFVVIQSEGRQDGQSGLFFDIFRLQGGKLAEQWGVHRIMP